MVKEPKLVKVGGRFFRTSGETPQQDKLVKEQLKKSQTQERNKQLDEETKKIQQELNKKNFSNINELNNTIKTLPLEIQKRLKNYSRNKQVQAQNLVNKQVVDSINRVTSRKRSVKKADNPAKKNKAKAKLEQARFLESELKQLAKEVKTNNLINIEQRITEIKRASRKVEKQSKLQSFNLERAKREAEQKNKVGFKITTQTGKTQQLSKQDVKKIDKLIQQNKSIKRIRGAVSGVGSTFEALTQSRINALRKINNPLEREKQLRETLLGGRVTKKGEVLGVFGTSREQRIIRTQLSKKNLTLKNISEIKNISNKALNKETMTPSEIKKLNGSYLYKNKQLKNEKKKLVVAIASAPVNYGKNLVIRRQRGERNPLGSDILNFSKGVYSVIFQPFVDVAAAGVRYGQRIVIETQKGNFPVDDDLKKVTRTILKGAKTTAQISQKAIRFAKDNPIKSAVIVGLYTGTLVDTTGKKIKKLTVTQYKKNPSFFLGQVFGAVTPTTVLLKGVQGSAKLTKTSLKKLDATLFSETRLTSVSKQIKELRAKKFLTRDDKLLLRNLEKQVLIDSELRFLTSATAKEFKNIPKDIVDQAQKNSKRLEPKKSKITPKEKNKISNKAKKLRELKAQAQDLIKLGALVKSPQLKGIEFQKRNLRNKLKSLKSKKKKTNKIKKEIESVQLQLKKLSEPKIKTKVTQKELSSVKSLKKESDKLVKKQKDIQEKLTPLSSKKNRERVKIRAENIQKKLKQSNSKLIPILQKLESKTLGVNEKKKLLDQVNKIKKDITLFGQELELVFDLTKLSRKLEKVDSDFLKFVGLPKKQLQQSFNNNFISSLNIYKRIVVSKKKLNLTEVRAIRQKIKNILKSGALVKKAKKKTKKIQITSQKILVGTKTRKVPQKLQSAFKKSNKTPKQQLDELKKIYTKEIKSTKKLSRTSKQKINTILSDTSKRKKFAKTIKSREGELAELKRNLQFAQGVIFDQQISKTLRVRALNDIGRLNNQITRAQKELVKLKKTISKPTTKLSQSQIAGRVATRKDKNFRKIKITSSSVKDRSVTVKSRIAGVEIELFLSIPKTNQRLLSSKKARVGSLKSVIPTVKIKTRRITKSADIEVEKAVKRGLTSAIRKNFNFRKQYNDLRSIKQLKRDLKNFLPKATPATKKKLNTNIRALTKAEVTSSNALKAMVSQSLRGALFVGTKGSVKVALKPQVSLKKILKIGLTPQLKSELVKDVLKKSGDIEVTKGTKKPKVPKSPKVFKRVRIAKTPKVPKGGKLIKVPKIPKITKLPPKKIKTFMVDINNIPAGKRLAYDAFYLRGGRVRRISIGLPERSASNKAFELIDRTLARSVELVPVGYTARKDVKLSDRAKKFRRRKNTKLKTLQLVEKSKFAIDTRGEKKGLKLKSSSKPKKANKKSKKVKVSTKTKKSSKNKPKVAKKRKK